MKASMLGQSKHSTHLQVLGYVGALCGLFFFADYAFATTGNGSDLQTVAENVTGNLGAVAKLIAAASYVSGVAFALAGMVKFKAHRDNPSQVPLSAPIVLIAVAAGLIFLPSVIQTAGQTVFQGGTSGGATGAGLDLGT